MKNILLFLFLLQGVISFVELSEWKKSSVAYNTRAIYMVRYGKCVIFSKRFVNNQQLNDCC